MKKFFILLAFSFLFFFVLPAKAEAIVCQDTSQLPTTAIKGQTITIAYNLSDEPGSRVYACNEAGRPSNEACYEIWGCNHGWGGQYGCDNYSHFNFNNYYSVTSNGKSITATITRDAHLEYWLEKIQPNGERLVELCNRQTMLVNNQSGSCSAGVMKVVKKGTDRTDYTYNDELEVIYDGTKTSGFHDLGTYRLWLEDATGAVSKEVMGLGGPGDCGEGVLELSGIRCVMSGRGNLNQLDQGSYRLNIEDIYSSQEYCPYSFEVSADGNNSQGGTGDQQATAFKLCQQAGATATNESHPCMKCMIEDQGVWTAFGCIPYGDGGNATGMIQVFIRLGLSIGGGVVVLMILGGGFMLTTSQGDPKRVEEAKAMVTSAVMGLVFIIFSITLLRFIGVQILQIPGFGS